MKSDILHQLHAAHLGSEKTRLLIHARVCVLAKHLYRHIYDGEIMCSLSGEQAGALSTTSPRSRCTIHTVDQGGQRYSPDQRGNLSARYRFSLEVLSCREDALNNKHCNRKQDGTMVQQICTTTRNSHRQRPTVGRAAIRRHVQ